MYIKIVNGQLIDPILFLQQILYKLVGKNGYHEF